MERNRPTRTHYAGAVTNADLVRLVTDTARQAAQRMTWPRQLPRKNAARLLWRYMRQVVKYKAEPPSDQVVRFPSATVKQRKGDCKSSAVFIAAAARAAGHQAALRFVQQRSPYWSHVYAVVDGVPVDPLLPFGTEVVYSRKLDKPL